MELWTGFGGPKGFGENQIGRNDDGYDTNIDITGVFGPNGLNFFGTDYKTLSINTNGNVTFGGDGLSAYTPYAMSSESGNPMVAAFFADVDTRGGRVSPSPGGTSKGTNKVWYDLDPTGNGGLGVLTITWDDVGYFSYETDKVNAFQLQLIGTGNGNFNIKFNYETINWTTGKASNGVNGLGGIPARAGYTKGDGITFKEMPYSGDQNALLNLGTTIGSTGNPGVYKLVVQNGEPGVLGLNQQTQRVQNQEELVEIGSLFATLVYGDINLAANPSLASENVASNYWGSSSADDGFDDNYIKYFEDNKVLGRQWKILTATDLPGAINPTDCHSNFTTGGLYHGWIEAAGMIDQVDNNKHGNSNALVAVSEDTMVFAFRGTDGKDKSFRSGQAWTGSGLFAHYAAFKPLIHAAQIYYNSHDNIKHIIFAGHSLGGGMADIFTATDGRYFASPNDATKDLTIVSFASNGIDEDLFTDTGDINSIKEAYRDSSVIRTSSFLGNKNIILSTPSNNGFYYSFANEKDRVYFPGTPAYPKKDYYPNATLLGNEHFKLQNKMYLPNISNKNVHYGGVVFKHGFGAHHNSLIYWRNIEELNEAPKRYRHNNLIFGVGRYAYDRKVDGVSSSGWWNPNRDSIHDKGQGWRGRALQGTESPDSIFGLEGNDELFGRKNRDYLNGGEGNDTLGGGRGHDYLDGGNGNDTLFGGLGNDSLCGGENNDLLFADTKEFSENRAFERIKCDWKGADYLEGNGGNDTLFGGFWHDILKGGTEEDVLYGEYGRDTLDGGTGNDTLYGGSGFDSLLGGADNDKLYGANGHDTLLGGHGDDTLKGGLKGDELRGGDDEDTLYGGRGHDTLFGGHGDDILKGGVGNDAFGFNSSLSDGGIDTIIDFTSGEDYILLEREVFVGLNERFLSDNSFTANILGMARDENDRILYNTSTGALLFDADGTGSEAAIQFAKLEEKQTLQATDFIIV